MERETYQKGIALLMAAYRGMRLYDPTAKDESTQKIQTTQTIELWWNKLNQIRDDEFMYALDRFTTVHKNWFAGCNFAALILEIVEGARKEEREQKRIQDSHNVVPRWLPEPKAARSECLEFHQKAMTRFESMKSELPRKNGEAISEYCHRQQSAFLQECRDKGIIIPRPYAEQWPGYL